MLRAHGTRLNRACTRTCARRHGKNQSEDRSSPFARRGDGEASSATCSKGGVSGTKRLWAHEIETVVKAYKWMIQFRGQDYAKCSEAVIVYQLRRSQSLPAGLYVYKTCPLHFGCTAERPVAVLDQFNFVSHPDHNLDRFGGDTLPKIITIDLFPGCDNYSAVYVMDRKIHFVAPLCEWYNNRMFGEARALGFVSSHPTPEPAYCDYHLVGMRNSQVCVMDLRWNAFETKIACRRAIPKIRGMQAVLWSNHENNFQDVECTVLAWLFGVSNELPKEVQLIDYKNEALGVRYIVMNMDKFPGVLPDPPVSNTSLFIHTHFTGDLKLATKAIGTLPSGRSRMASPHYADDAFAVWYALPPKMGRLQPTPFSCGTTRVQANLPDNFKKSLLDWSMEQDGANCMAIAVQHTLYFHHRQGGYKMMLTHIVRDNDTSLDIFRL